MTRWLSLFAPAHAVSSDTTFADLALGYARLGAGALIFSKEAPDLLWGMARCLRSFGGLPQTLVTDREGALHAGDGKPTEP